ncbi:MAG: 5-formyltetrahydrofolate cyclo-ligase [Candidatus Omnitrophica bacterium]|nr:5-formyltetrahydrofolate cyclo-ligase [Candidatus Omnitrophota bacterium]
MQKEEIRLRKSLKIKRMLFSLREFRRAKMIMFYLAHEGEVETTGMIYDAWSMGKKVCAPVLQTKEKRMIAAQVTSFTTDIEKGPYGILQPQAGCLREIPGELIDLIVVPGVAFDDCGNRLGRGAGYYDRFLAGFQERRVPCIGLAFSFQLLGRIPVSSHDIPMTKVLAA